MKKRILALMLVVLLVILISLPVGISVTGDGVLSIRLGGGDVGAQEVGELMGLRDRTTKVYYLGIDQYSMDVSIGSVHYQDEYNEWQEIDNQWVPAGELSPWDWQMLEAGYHIRVLEDFTYGQILEFEKQGESVQLQPMDLEWTNDLDQIQLVSNPQSITPIITNPEVDLLPAVGMLSHQGTIRWDDAYGNGIDFEWQCTSTRLTKILEIEHLNNLPVPEQYILDGGNPVLRLNLIFDPSKGTDTYINGDKWNQATKIQTFGVIEFRKDNEVLWGFMPLRYWGSYDGGDEELLEANYGQSVATLEKRGNKLYISVRVPYDWLQTAAYPVFIDTDVDEQVGANLDDVDEIEGTGTVADHASFVVHKSSTNADYRYWGAHRWVSGSLPVQGSTIGVAYAEVRVPSTQWDDANGNWHFQKAASPAQFTTDDYDVTDRTRTDASVSEIHNSVGTGWFGTESLVAPLQEVVDSYSPTVLVLIFRPNQDAIKYLQSSSHNYDPDLAAKLHIEWSVSCAPDISNTPSLWEVNGGAPVDVSSNYTTGLTFFNVTNSSGGAIDISISATSMTSNTAMYEYYDDTPNQLEAIYDNYWIAQTFTPKVPHSLTKVNLLLQRLGTPGTLTVYIKETVDGHPTGSLLATGTTDGNTIPSGSPEWREIVLDNPCNVNADTKYAIVAKVLGGSSGNQLYWVSLDDNYGDPPTYAGGCMEFTTLGDVSWLSVTWIDVMFEEWGIAFPWVLSDTATPGDMQYGLKAGLEGGSYNVTVKLTSPYNNLVGGLADSTSQRWGLQIFTPTIYSDGSLKSGDVTITAVCQ